MKHIAAITLMPLLAACAAPQIVYKPVPVDRPVPVLCRAPEVPEPAWPTTGITSKNTLFEEVRAALAELDVRKGYEVRLKAAVKACK